MQIQPAPDYQYQQSYIQKPKSWDNLSAKAVGGYGYGYEYISAPGGHNNSLKGTSSGHQYVPMEPHSMCGYRVHPQQQQQPQHPHQHHHVHGANNPGSRKPVYQHYGMKGAATNTEPTPYSSMPCQHVHSQQQQTTNNNSKTLDNNGGLMMTKYGGKADHCTASGCAGNVSGCSSNAAKK